MKFLITFALIVLTSCTSHRGTLYIDKTDSTIVRSKGVGFETTGVLSLKEYEKAKSYLERNVMSPIFIVGKDSKINSYKEYCTIIKTQFPSPVSQFHILSDKTDSSMDYKDVWLSKGPPYSIFLTDSFITWRYKEGNWVTFVEGKVSN